MIRYLSLDWINALSDAVASSDQLRSLAEHHQINVTQVVTNGPEGDVTYHLAVNDGEAGATTRSPARKPRTSAPTSSTTPQYS